MRCHGQAWVSLRTAFPGLLQFCHLCGRGSLELKAGIQQGPFPCPRVIRPGVCCLVHGHLVTDTRGLCRYKTTGRHAVLRAGRPRTPRRYPSIHAKGQQVLMNGNRSRKPWEDSLRTCCVSMTGCCTVCCLPDGHETSPGAALCQKRNFSAHRQPGMGSKSVSAAERMVGQAGPWHIQSPRPGQTRWRRPSSCTSFRRATIHI